MKQVQSYLGKSALVTGGGRGIGLGIARRLAEEGAHVVIADVNIEKGTQAAQGLRDRGLSVDFLPVDLSVPGGSEEMVAAATLLMGRVDVLVNNARAGRRLGLLEETEENWDQAVAVGLKAAFFTAQATIRLMAERGG